MEVVAIENIWEQSRLPKYLEVVAIKKYLGAVAIGRGVLEIKMRFHILKYHVFKIFGSSRYR